MLSVSYSVVLYGCCRPISLKPLQLPYLFAILLLPTGHSAFQGVLSSPRGGYRGLMWAREPAAMKNQSCGKKELERVWQPSASLGSSAVTFAGVFVEDYFPTWPQLQKCQHWDFANCNYGTGNFSGSQGLGNSDSLSRYLLDVYVPSLLRGSNGYDILMMLGADFDWWNGVDHFEFNDGGECRVNVLRRVFHPQPSCAHSTHGTPPTSRSHQWAQQPDRKHQRRAHANF